MERETAATKDGPEFHQDPLTDFSCGVKALIYKGTGNIVAETTLVKTHCSGRKGPRGKEHTVLWGRGRNKG